MEATQQVTAKASEVTEQAVDKVATAHGAAMAKLGEATACAKRSLEDTSAAAKAKAAIAAEVAADSATSAALKAEGLVGRVRDARQDSYLAQKRQLNSQRAWRAARNEMLAQAAGAVGVRESRVISFGDLRTVAQGRSVDQAKERARLEQCVKVVRRADGTEELQRYPIIKLEGAADLSHGSVRGEADFGLPVAIILYLRLLLYASVVLLLMFLISLPQMLENRRHFLVRLDCRDALRSHFAALTAPDAAWERFLSGAAADGDSFYGYTGCAAANASASGVGFGGGEGSNGTNGTSSSFESGSGDGDGGAWLSSNVSSWQYSMSQTRATCGYAGLSELRCDNPALDVLTEVYLSFALGSCMEYDAAQSGTLPTNALLDFGSYFTDALIEASFVRTPAAGFCHAGFYTFSWVANVLVWLAMLVLLRRTAKFVTASHDQHHWTAADYALMITGLQRRVPADDGEHGRGLESRLRDDLQALGFGPDDVDHIEVGRFCVKEMRLHRRKLALNILENEIDSRRQHFKKVKGVDEAKKLQKGEVKARTKEDKAYLKDTAAHGQARQRAPATPSCAPWTTFRDSTRRGPLVRCGCGRCGRTWARCRSSWRLSGKAPPAKASSRQVTHSSASPPRRDATSCSSCSRGLISSISGSTACSDGPSGPDGRRRRRSRRPAVGTTHAPLACPARIRRIPRPHAPRRTPRAALPPLASRSDSHTLALSHSRTRARALASAASDAAALCAPSCIAGCVNTRRSAALAPTRTSCCRRAPRECSRGGRGRRRRSRSARSSHPSRATSTGRTSNSTARRTSSSGGS